MEGIMVPLSVIAQALHGDVEPLRMHAKSVGFPIDQPMSEVRISSKDNSLDDVKEIWEMWMTLFYKDGRKPKLTDKKKKIIQSRLRSFSSNDLKIVMCWVRTSKFWMGANERDSAYYFIPNIFRSDDRVESLLVQASEWKTKATSLLTEIARLDEMNRKHGASLDDAMARSSALNELKELGYTRVVDSVLRTL